jgi:pimeloyl-ACP methyl ester carboxylesterase
MSYIRSGDAAVYYEEYGTGEPLVLIPGLLGSIESHWRRFLPEYARHFHTIAVDLRGHGKTDNPSGVLRLDQCVDDLHALLDTLQIEQAFILGYSFGGYLALAYALRHAAAVRALAVHATKFYWSSESVAGAAGLLDPDAAAATVPEWVTALESDHRPGNGPAGWRVLMEAARNLLQSLPRQGIPESALSAIRCPVLVSHCDDDDMIPLSEADRLAAVLPDARLHRLPGCRHQMQSVPKRPFVDLSVEFFRSAHTSSPV